MSAQATGWVWQHSRHTGIHLLIHLAIADVVNDANGNEFWMSTGALARKARVSRSTVVSALRDMVEEGELEVVESGEASRKPTRYRFTSALGGLASATNGLASAPDDLALARQARTNSIELNELNEPMTSALSGLAKKDCLNCHGEGEAYHPGAGRVARCDCTKKLAKTERRA